MNKTSTLLLGDCAEQMRTLAPSSVDAIVTDPPYGLSFMGKNWDHGVPGEAFWREALRVAKPGAHLLAFGGTRTYHRLACAIEDAGWEVRDCIMWVYGSGFPKSMDVAKAIDKASGYEGEVIGSRIVDVGMQGGNMHAGRKQQQQQQIRALSPEAAAWQGWGTALKPACEPIVIARKPIEGTVAANVLKYGTGAINIDGCRVPTEETISCHGNSVKASETRSVYGKHMADVPHQTDGQKLGRFPANLVHDGSPEVLALFPDSKGQCGAVKGNEPSELTRGIYGKFSDDRLPCEPRNDSGSAARFFYCAKASRSERGEGERAPDRKAPCAYALPRHPCDSSRRYCPRPLHGLRLHGSRGPPTRPPVHRHRARTALLRHRRVPHLRRQANHPNNPTGTPAMTNTPAIIEAKFRAGYRAPQENPLACKNCGAVGFNPSMRHCYFCKRHQFYVHSRGYCPMFSAEKYEPRPQRKPMFAQEELFG